MKGTLDKFQNLLENFETGEIFLKSLDQIEFDEDKKTWIPLLVAEFCLQNEVNENFLRFFLDYLAKDENVISLLVGCSSMTLELYKEYENKFSFYEKLSSCLISKYPLEIREYIIRQLTNSNEVDEVFVFIEPLFNQGTFSEEFVKEITEKLNK